MLTVKELIVSAFIIASSIGTTAANTGPTGYGTQGRLQYAVNAGLYYCVFLNTASATTALSARYSSNSGASWSTPSGSPLTLANASAGRGLSFGFAYANISSTDVLHMASAYGGGGTTNRQYAARFTLGTTWSNTNAESLITTSPADFNGTLPSGSCTALDSNNLPFSAGLNVGNNGDPQVARAASANTDSGSSWSGYGTYTHATPFSGAHSDASNFLAALASAKMLWIGGNASADGKFTQLEYSVYNGSWGASATVLASTVTQTDDAAWGAVRVSATNIIAVALSNNSTTYVARTFNGTSWSNLGAAPGTLAYGTNSGISLVSDGANVWAAAIDTSKNIQYNKWNGASWGGWTVLEATRTNTPSYITGIYNATNNEIMWAWSEVNGSNFDIIGSVLTLSPPPTTKLFLPATLSLGAGGPFFQTPVNA